MSAWTRRLQWLPLGAIHAHLQCATSRNPTSPSIIHYSCTPQATQRHKARDCQIRGAHGKSRFPSATDCTEIQKQLRGISRRLRALSTSIGQSESVKGAPKLGEQRSKLMNAQPKAPANFWNTRPGTDLVQNVREISQYARRGKEYEIPASNVAIICCPRPKRLIASTVPENFRTDSMPGDDEVERRHIDERHAEDTRSHERVLRSDQKALLSCSVQRAVGYLSLSSSWDGARS